MWRWCILTILAITQAWATDITEVAYDSNAAIVLLVWQPRPDQRTMGTGFFVNTTGMLVTNYHVIMNAPSVTAYSSRGEALNVLGIRAVDPRSDLAVLQVAVDSSPSIALASRAELTRFAPMVVIGHTFGTGRVYTSGILNSFRDLPRGVLWLQYSGTITPGFSGGPALLENGKLAGVTTKHVVGEVNSNYAISAPDVARLVTQAEQEEVVPFSEFRYPPLVPDNSGLSDRDQPVVWAKAGQEAEQQGDQVRAEFCYKRAVEIDPDFKPGLALLAGFYTGLERWEAAKQVYQRLKKIDESPALDYNLGLLYWKCGDAESAEAVLRRALVLDPDFTQASDLLKRVLRPNGRP